MPTIQQTESFLTFKLSDELFAINVSKVLEILEVKPITRVPNASGFMKGVINLRGNILPVVDTRNKFAMPEAEFTIDTCIIVLSIHDEKDPLLVGAIVDSVQKVIDIPDDSIQASPSLGLKCREDFITGIGKIEKDFVMILNIDKVFSAHDVYTSAEDN